MWLDQVATRFQGEVHVAVSITLKSALTASCVQDFQRQATFAAGGLVFIRALLNSS